MQGIELSESFYRDEVAPMIRKKFPQYESRIAAGLCGHGSECFGYDDELSRDHDFDAGCCLWISEADDAVFGEELRKEYALLPPDYNGTHITAQSKGGVFKGVMTIPSFYRKYTGSDGAPETLMQWLSVPSTYLAEATNGKVFRDDLGEFSGIRETLLHGMPEDVRLKKIAARCSEAAQAGQYNYARCLRHGEQGAARLAVDAFVRAAAELAFLLEKKHMPYYKWMFRAMKDLTLTDISAPLEFLLIAEDDGEVKEEIIEDVCRSLCDVMHKNRLSSADGIYLEGHAWSVMERIHSPQLRSLHIMEG